MTSEKTMRDLPVRWRDPSKTVGETFLAVHRGAFMSNQEIVEAGNSIPAIERADSLGCGIVEVSLHFSADGTAIIIRDDMLDRTTEMIGPVRAHRYDDLKDACLVYPAKRKAFEAKLPTSDEVFEALSGHKMINVECKTGVRAFPKVAKVARRAGVLPQVTVKTHCNTDEQLDAVLDSLQKCDDPIDYIPVVTDRRIDLNFLETMHRGLEPNCIECVVAYPSGFPDYKGHRHLGHTVDGRAGVDFPIAR